MLPSDLPEQNFIFNFSFSLFFSFSLPSLLFFSPLFCSYLFSPFYSFKRLQHPETMNAAKQVPQACSLHEEKKRRKRQEDMVQT